jgi:hypothetical protein
MRDRIRGEETGSPGRHAFLINSSSIRGLISDINQELNHFDGLNHTMGIARMTRDESRMASLAEEMHKASERVIARVDALSKYSETWK